MCSRKTLRLCPLPRGCPSRCMTVADSDPAVAVTVTWLGVSPVAHIQVSMPTTVALVMPSPVVILGFVSTCGAGMVTESMAALTRVRASI